VREIRKGVFHFTTHGILRQEKKKRSITNKGEEESFSSISCKKPQKKKKKKGLLEKGKTEGSCSRTSTAKEEKGGREAFSGLNWKKGKGHFQPPGILTIKQTRWEKEKKGREYRLKKGRICASFQ